MAIVQRFFGSVKEYIEAFLSQGCPFSVPDLCPHPDCQAVDSLIRWGTYERNALTGDADFRIRIQRVRCKACSRTDSLLPDFLHPYRHFVISLLHQVVSFYLIAELGWRQVMRQLRELYDRAPTHSTVREWIASFAYGAGHLLLDVLQRHLLALDPGIEMPDSPPKHMNDVPDPLKRRRLEKAHAFWLLAEDLYAQVKRRQSNLHFAAIEFFPFLLHWLQGRELPPRLFWSPLLSTTPTEPF